MDIIRSFEQALYTNAELDRAIIRAIRDLMIEHDLWELHMEGTAQEILLPGGALYVFESGAEDDPTEAVNDYLREWIDILFDEKSISLFEDGEQGMTFLYHYEDERECRCTDPYCGV